MNPAQKKGIQAVMKACSTSLGMCMVEDDLLQVVARMTSAAALLDACARAVLVSHGEGGVRDAMQKLGHMRALPVPVTIGDDK